MEKIFNEKHLEILNQMFDTFVFDIVANIKDEVMSLEGRAFYFPITKHAIFKVAADVTDSSIIELFNDSANKQFDKIIFYGGRVERAKGAVYIYCKAKREIERDSIPLYSKRYKFFPASLTVENSDMSRVISEVPREEATNVCIMLDKILGRKESINCTYKQFIDKVGRFFLSRRSNFLNTNCRKIM